MSRIKLTVTPEAMRDTTITIGTHEIDVRVHWRIKAGYALARIGLKIVEMGSRLAGCRVQHEDAE